MTTVQHPRFRQQSFKGPNYQTQLTTYDLVSDSPAGLKYTFGNSKADRFSTIKPRHPNQQIGYDLPSTRDSKSPSFGIGERFKDQEIRNRKCKFHSDSRLSSSQHLRHSLAIQAQQHNLHVRCAC